TSGLDPILRERTWDWFRELRQEGRTLLVTGHYLAEAELCDRIALIVEGRLAALGTPRELRHRALGGDLVEGVVGGALPAARETRREDRRVRKVGVWGPGGFLVTVPEGGPAVPIILEPLRSRGVGVHWANEFRPPFDEVYERLVEHD